MKESKEWKTGGGGERQEAMEEEMNDGRKEGRWSGRRQGSNEEGRKQAKEGKTKKAKRDKQRREEVGPLPPKQKGLEDNPPPHHAHTTMLDYCCLPKLLLQ